MDPENFQGRGYSKSEAPLYGEALPLPKILPGFRPLYFEEAPFFTVFFFFFENKRIRLVLLGGPPHLKENALGTQEVLLPISIYIGRRKEAPSRAYLGRRPSTLDRRCRCLLNRRPLLTRAGPGGSRRPPPPSGFFAASEQTAALRSAVFRIHFYASFPHLS